MVKLHDVVARIQGSTHSDEWIIRGNHFDAWVNGAEDPTSGQVCLLEEARAMGVLMKQGWRPKRTIMYCAWDGEEQGLLGSTEWVEAHADELKANAALYINTDSNGRGYLRMGGSHSLEKFINGVAKDITDPEKNISAWQRLMYANITDPMSADERNKLRNNDIAIDALGSGSDFTPFLEHAGVASLNLGYGGEDGGGIYHSIYDTFYWYTHFSDTSFVYGRALAQTVGTAVMRFADAELLPYNFKSSTNTIGQYVDELKKLAKKKREDIVEQNRMIDEGAFTATSDPHEKYVPPAIEVVPPFLNFTPFDNAMASFNANAERYQKAAEKFQATNKPLPKAINKKLIESERRLMDENGLPNRPWFKHQIYAPGLYTGYGVKTIPAVREAIEQKKWKEAEEQIARVAKVLESEAELIQSVAVELESVVK
jgi:N-acetylated-alpha-linked acidic dipeptidase